VLDMGDQAMVQLAGEQRDAVHSRVVPKPVADHADLWLRVCRSTS
jgi:hypothetical protein